MPDDDRFSGMADALEGGDQDDEREETTSTSTSAPRRDEQRAVVSGPSGFQETLRDRLSAVEDGDLSRNATAYDGELAALLAALDADEERMDEVAERLADELGRERVDAKKSTILSVAARIGLQEADPDLMEDLLDVRADRARQL